MAIPEGFVGHFRSSSVTDPWKPLYSRAGAECVELGLVIAEPHCNGRGLIHGGVIATLSDNAMGLSLAAVARQKAPDEAHRISALTVSLGVDYLASGKPGQWLQITPRVLRAGRTLGFVDAVVTADGQPIARAHASFQLAAPKAA